MVIDEASMMDVASMNQMLKVMPMCVALLMVGEVDELPSVGPGAVLSGIIDSRQIPAVRLTEIFRQASNSQIIINAAHRINQGKLLLQKPAADLTDLYCIPAETPEEIFSKLIHVVADTAAVQPASGP